MTEQATNTVRAIDVADYILSKLGAMSVMKLQKLVYYSQCWHLAWEEDILFNDNIEAWANGPVVPNLYSLHRGEYKITPGFFKGEPDRLSALQKADVDLVLGYYGDKTPQWLSDLTHRESPWREARDGLPDGERGNQVIAPSAMAEYYGSL